MCDSDRDEQAGLLSYEGHAVESAVQDLLVCGTERRSLRFLGECVCRECYLEMHGVTEHAWKTAMTLFQSNELPKDGADRAGRPAVQFEVCVRFVHEWIWARVVSTSRDGRPHLPFWPRISWLYYDFREYCVAKFISVIPSEGTFRMAAKQELATVSLPRGNADLKGCSMCTRNVLAFEKACNSNDPDEAARIRAVQRQHELVAMEERHSYHNRRKFAQDNPNVCWTFVQDWTHPFQFPMLYQRTAERDHCQKFHVNYWVQINHCERFTTDHQGVNFFWFIGGDGKDNGNANASAIFYNVKQRLLSGVLPLRADLQLDSGSGGKCCTTVGVLAFLMESHGHFPEGIDVHFMISGHTGDDMDAVTAHVRSKCHQFGNWWSPDEVLDHFPKFYPHGQPPLVTQFNDFQFNEDHPNTTYNARFAGHFLYDWAEFLTPYAMSLAGISDKFVTRTEDSIHWWVLRLTAGGRVTLQVARRSVGDFAILSDPVFVFNRKPPAAGPSRIFFCDKKHAVAGGVVLPAVVKAVLAEQEHVMPQEGLLFYRGLLDEMTMCKFPEIPVAANAGRVRKKAQKRVVDLTVAPTLTARPPKGVVESDDENEMDDVAAGGAVEDGSEESEGEESSEEELFRDAANGEAEFEVLRILDKETKRGKVRYLVLYKTDDNEPASWQPEENLDGAEKLVKDFENARKQADRARQNLAVKDVGRALHHGPEAAAALAAQMGRTRSATVKRN